MVTIDTIVNLKRHGAGRMRPRSRFRAMSFGLVERFAHVTERWRQRRDLRDLTDDQLRDIGLTPNEARREAARPFWD